MSNKKIVSCLILTLMVGCLFSCTTGEYMTLRSNEKAEVLGTVRSTFTITGAFRYRSVINTQAYINLMSEAQKEFSGDIDVRDISWAIGKSDTANNNYEYSAIGRVVRK